MANCLIYLFAVQVKVLLKQVLGILKKAEMGGWNASPTLKFPLQHFKIVGTN
jgi:hypothetical protein